MRIIRELCGKIWEFVSKYPILSYSVCYLLILGYFLIIFKPYSNEVLLSRSKALIKEKDFEQQVEDVVNLNKGLAVSLHPNYFYSIDLKLSNKDESPIRTNERRQERYYTDELTVYLNTDNTFLHLPDNKLEKDACRLPYFFPADRFMEKGRLSSITELPIKDPKGIFF